mgnify:CR=1 FL=1
MRNSWSDLPWHEIGDEAVKDLQSLLRIDTTNPPGNESKAAEFVADRLREDNLEPVILDSAPNRSNVITRIEGSEDLAPLLISAHLDVVPAEGQWTHPPFGGEIHDGCVWGRGAVDMKQMAVMCMWMMKLLARQEKPPKRTVIFAAVADEECGCDYGSHWIVDNHPDLVRAGYMITEIGGFTLYIQGRRFYPIQVAEKGRVLLKLKAQGPAGHASIPKKNTALTQLSEALMKLGQTSLPRHIPLAQRHFIEQVAAELPFPIRRVFKLILSPIGDKILNLLPAAQADPLKAALHNTVTPTIIQTNDTRNVIPEEAVALLDGRTLPGQTAVDLVREIRDVIGNRFTIEVEDEKPPVWMDDYKTDLYELMYRAIKKHDPEGTPVPWLVPGFTDAKAWHRLGMRCYGFSPLQLPKDLAFSSLFHAPNERVPIQGFQWGLRVLADVVGQFVL